MPESADPGTAWVDVYSKTTGVKHTIPAGWLEDPVLGADFRKTPLTRASEQSVDKPADTSATK